MNISELYIKKLNLLPHPEGGFYKEIYRSAGTISEDSLSGYEGPRNFVTAIYFLLKSGIVSRFHKLRSDEIWNFLDGSPVNIYLLDGFSNLSEIRLGKNIESDEILQFVIEKEKWFAAEVIGDDNFSLVSCIVAPGFDFRDFTMGQRDELCSLYPQHTNLIRKFT